jgi:chorismate mutase
MIEQEHANTRLQIAEREERMFQRARQAENESTTDEPINASAE